MPNDFKIQFTIRTADGYEPLCDFYIGNNRKLAHAIFAQLEGNDEVLESDVLQANLFETNDGLPVDVQIKHCTLSQMGASCCLITKEMFKYRNLERGG